MAKEVIKISSGRVKFFKKLVIGRYFWQVFCDATRKIMAVCNWCGGIIFT
jgi:hypothetical protein